MLKKAYNLHSKFFMKHYATDYNKATFWLWKIMPRNA